MCTTLRNFFSKAYGFSNSVTITAALHHEEQKDYITELKDTRTMTVSDFQCSEDTKGVNVNFTGSGPWGREKVSLTFPKGGVHERFHERVRERKVMPYDYVIKEELRFSEKGQGPMPSRFRTHTLFLYTKDKNALSASSQNMPDFSFGYRQPYWTVEKELQEELEQNKLSRWDLKD